MITITKERLQWLANISGRDDIDDIDGGEIRELARIALASLEQNVLSGNSTVIPGEVLSAIREVARIRADFDDFDGDRRGIGDCLDEAEQELIVTINKYASQLAAEPIAPNDVREQTAIPQVPVTPDGWISCSERMPDDGQHVIILCDGAFVLYAQYRDGEFFDVVRNGDEFFETQSRNVTDWMPLPEPPQEVRQ